MAPAINHFPQSSKTLLMTSSNARILHMATLNFLKDALRQSVEQGTATKPLSDGEYRAGFELLIQDQGLQTYQDFIVPQLCELLTPVIQSKGSISVLEIGPGPKTVLGYLPGHLRCKIKRYDAFEPNGPFAWRLEDFLTSRSDGQLLFSSLEQSPIIHRIPFGSEDSENATSGADAKGNDYDVVLFCHSMYGMKPKRKYIERALEMLDGAIPGGEVVVFHRAGSLNFDGLVCDQYKSFPTGAVCVWNDNETLDRFASFIAGFIMKDPDVNGSLREEWRNICRALGRHEKGYPHHLVFSSPEMMTTFNRNATKLSELTMKVSLADQNLKIKNWEARLHQPAAVIGPTELQHIQQCVWWALKYNFSLTVVGGSHSGHCRVPNVVAIDMSAFDGVDIVESGAGSKSETVVVVGSGSKTGEIISKTMTVGLTVPLGSRPSVGAGIWLQGGIGHLSRQHGLACDSIVGAVLVSVKSGQVVCVGYVPTPHQPPNSVRVENEEDLLWALKGAGTNFGIVVSIVFRTYPATTYLTTNPIFKPSGRAESQFEFKRLQESITLKNDLHHSADVFLYYETDQLHLGINTFELSPEPPTPEDFELMQVVSDSNGKRQINIVDGIGLFDIEMYMSSMHGGHAGGKTSSFKRCVFFGGIGDIAIIDRLLNAIDNRPSSLCYLHLLHAGGAVSEVNATATAFGCRDWSSACVITGVWPRGQEGSKDSDVAIRWVHEVAMDLLPVSNGVYSADLGPDPRDAVLATRAFGINLPRLATLKQIFDPQNVLAYTCPLLKPQKPKQKLVIIVTGESCTGKDYSAEVWLRFFQRRNLNRILNAQVASISEATKREYAEATNSDFQRLVSDRVYKEQHRPALTAFFEEQVRLRPHLPEEHFRSVVGNSVDADVLLITGLREESALVSLSHLTPDTRLIEINIQTNEQVRILRGAREERRGGIENGSSSSRVVDYQPTLTFINNEFGPEAAEIFAERYLMPLVHNDVQRLSRLIRQIPDFPGLGVNFQHVLGISQQHGGLELCTSLFSTQFIGQWSAFDAIVCCEAGGFVFASALAAQVNLRLLLIRDAGKLPPPTISVGKSSSHISSLNSDCSTLKDGIEMEQGVASPGTSVVVVDDVLASGETLCAVLQLLGKAGIEPEDIHVMVVAEFPLHRGRALLQHRGFGRVIVQSLLTLDGK